MTDFVDRVIKVEKHLAKKQGEFTLFALFEREDVPNKWDVVVSAAWIDKNERRGREIVAIQLRKGLSNSQILSLSRVIVVGKNDPALKVLRAIATQHQKVEVTDCIFFGLKIRHAYIITSHQH